MGNIFKTHIWGIFAICYLHITCYLYILHISVMKWGEINWDEVANALHHIAFRNGATLCWGWSNNCLAHSLTKWQNSDHVALSQLPCAHHLADVCPCQLTVSLKCCSWAWVFFPQWNVEGLLRDEFSHHASQNILKEHVFTVGDDVPTFSLRLCSDERIWSGWNITSTKESIKMSFRGRNNCFVHFSQHIYINELYQ